MATIRRSNQEVVTEESSGHAAITAEVPRATPAPRITFREILRNALRALIDLDFVVVRTVIGLIREPGRTARRYVDGERSRIMNPAKFVLVMSTLYVLVNALTTGSELEALFDPFMSMRGLWPYASLVLLLPAASLQRLLFRHRGLNTAECYAFSLLVFGEVALVGSALLTIQRVVDQRVPVWAVLGVAGVYASWAVTGLYHDRAVSVWVRGAMVFGFVVGSLAAALYAYQAQRFGSMG